MATNRHNRFSFFEFNFSMYLVIGIFFLFFGVNVNAQNLVNKAVNATISGSGNNLSNLKDNNPSTDWYATYNGSNYLLATFSSATIINGMGLSANGNGTEAAAKNETPKNITISGSNDGSTFTQLGGWNGLTWDRKGASKLFSFSNSTAYKYYKLSITETATNSGNESLSEWQLYDNMGISGKVYVRNSINNLYGFGNVTGDNGKSGINVSIVDENRTIIKTVITGADGSYVFSANDISYPTLSGDFSVIVTPLSGFRFVSDPTLTYTSHVSGKSNFTNARLQIQADGVFPFLSLETKYLTNLNNKRYVSNSRFSNTYTTLDFGLYPTAGVDFSQFYPSGYAAVPGNLITDISNGTFGTLSNSTASYVASHPNQPAFNASLSQGGGSGLYSTITNITSGYTFNDKPYTTGSNHNGVLADGNYAVTSFMGGLQGDISLVPIIYANPDGDTSMVGSLLESYYGGWRKTYGATTGDAFDQYGVFNGISSGSTSLLKTGSITLTAGKTYALFFNAKVANSYTANHGAGATTSTQIAINVLNASSTSIANGTITLTQPSQVADDEPSSAWDYKYVQFSPSSTGSYTINLVATGSGYNDFYIDNLGLYELKNTVTVSGSVVESTSNTAITGLTNLYAYLINSTGIILSKTTVGTDGVFSFSDAPSGTANMVVSLSTDNLTLGNTFITTTVPNGYTIPNGNTTASTSAFTTSSSNVTGLQVALTRNSTTLPITLKSFYGNAVSNQVNLYWQTASEINFKKFSIERCIDGRNWNSIGEVDAKGSSSSLNDYEFIDYSPSNSNLYRLRLIDLDGSFKVSNVISISLTSVQEQVKLYPNPASGFITLNGVTKGETLQIFNILGNLVKVIQVTSAQQTIDISSLKSGVYFVKRISFNNVQTIKFIKK